MHRDRGNKSLAKWSCPDQISLYTVAQTPSQPIQVTRRIGLLLCLAGFVTNNTWAPPMLSLLADNGDVLCVGTLYPTSSTVGNFTEATFLFQNNGGCIKGLSQTASLQFSPPDGQEGMMSFCVDKLELLLLPNRLNETLAHTGKQTNLSLTFS